MRTCVGTGVGIREPVSLGLDHDRRVPRPLGAEDRQAAANAIVLDRGIDRRRREGTRLGL